jgi:RNA polymerase sigma factor (sigma-70 family)
MNSVESAFDSKTATDNNLESMFSRDYAGICRYAHRIVNDPDDAAEIAQETFLRMQQVRGPASFSLGDRVLLYRVARNLSIDHLRRKQTRRRYAEADGQIPVLQAERSSEEELLAEERRAQVQLALRTLSPRDAKCLALRNAGHSYDELAAILNIHPGSVGPTVTRALRRLRQAYFAATTGTAPQAARPGMD